MEGTKPQLSMKDRLPPRKDLFLVFGWGAFLVNLWAIINLFYIVPAWLKRMNIGELIGSASYVLAFALIESLVIWSLPLLASIVLPNKWFRQHYLSHSALLVFISAAWSIALHSTYESVIANRQAFPFLAAAFILTLAIAYYVTFRFEKLGTIFRTILDRIAVLAYLYIFLDFLGVLVVIVRNVWKVA